MSDFPDRPHQAYAARLAARSAAFAGFERQHVNLGNARLGVAALAALIFWLAFSRHLVSPWWLALPAVVFAVLAVVHARVLRRRRRARRSVAFYERGLARLEDRWHGIGEGGERFSDPSHPFAEDLDLFGKGSLFQLLSTARLRTGEETLARWLLAPAPPEEVRARQDAVRELAPGLDFREEIALLGEDLRSAINPGELAKWAEQPLVFDSRALRVLAAILSALAVAGLVVWGIWSIPEFFLSVFIVESILYFRIRRRVRQVVDVVGEPAYGLALLSAILGKLESTRFESPRLRELTKALSVEGHPPSLRIARINRFMELLDSSEHVLLRAVGPLVLYVPQIALAVEAWRKKSGPHIRKWLVAVGEVEALCSFANYSYEHPADIFPELLPEGSCYEGEALGHPLLPEARAVRNDVRLCGELRAMIVSGSNMSGKSTLLRTVGVNAVLAMAGAPVRARRLRLSQLTLGASIRTMDSLQGGTSRFYAEITRIRALVELAAGSTPLLFLLDELLQGTNSHDRLIGAEAIVRGLLARDAFGLLTTHDLALTEIAAALAPRTRNVHFEDHLQDGKMTFDYLLRPGVVEKSNALALMRSIGLDV